MAPGYSTSSHDYNKETKEKFKSEYSNWQSKRPPHAKTDLQSFLSKPKPKLRLSTIDLCNRPVPLDPSYTVPKIFLDVKKNYHSSQSPTLNGGLTYFWFKIVLLSLIIRI